MPQLMNTIHNHRRRRNSLLYLQHFVDNPPCDEDRKQQAKFLVESKDFTPILNLIYSLFMLPREIERKRNPTKLKTESLFRNRKTKKLKEAKELIKYCIKYYPNSLCLKLIHIIQCSVKMPVTRNVSIILLRSLLWSLDDPWEFLSPTTLTEIKPRLISCLEQTKTWSTFKILSRIVSTIASQVFEPEAGGGGGGREKWPELFEYIDSSFGSDYEKGMLVFRDLPMNVSGEFVPLVHNFRENVLLGLKSCDPKVWALAFVASIKLLLHLAGKYEHDRVVVRRAIVASVTELVGAKREKRIRNGMRDWSYLIGEEGPSYSMAEVRAVYNLVITIISIEGIRPQTRVQALNVFTKLKNIRYRENV